MKEAQDNKNLLLKELSYKKTYFIVAVCLLIAHLSLEFIYIAFQAKVIHIVNIVSIMIYIVILLFYDHIPRKFRIRIIYCEVLLFSLAAVLLYGDEACYSLNVIPLIPIVCCWDYKTRYVYKESSNHLHMKIALCLIAIVYGIEQLLDGWNIGFGYEMTQQHIDAIGFFNFFTLFAGILIGTGMWWSLTNYTAEELESSLQRADYFANHDTLTGLKNRNSMNAYIKGLERKNEEYAFMIADVDNFKKFNDQYGHDCGDVVLQKISDTIHRYVRDEDQIFRWGGEEIVIIMSNIHRALAEERAAKICQAIAREECTYNGKKLSVTATIGISVSKGRRFQDVMKEADEFLFLGKTIGKNCAVGTKGVIRKNK